tara:strand:+ start:189 stop:896 length:708 start_codon:yes stop_codon:yes gene_type:complete
MPNTLKYRINSKKSLCKSKKEKKCKKIKGCKMARGPKKTFCRKIKNKKYGKTMKKRGGIGIPSMENMKKAAKASAVSAASAASMENMKKAAKASAMKTMANMAVDENKLKLVLNNLDEKKIKEFLSGINGLNEAQLKQLLSGDKNAIIGVIMQNKQLRSLVMKEMMNNSELRGLIIKLAKGSMRGGNLTEDELESLERTYKHATPTELEKIMNDESKERKERSIAQKILFEKLKF